MIVFVDASAIVAILTAEPERTVFLEIIDQADAITSPIALLESALGYSRKKGCALAQASRVLNSFLSTAKIREVAILPEDFAAALNAAKRFGKRSGSPAQLNLGDCFAYASTVRAKAKLLYKGNDFGRTDIASAIP